MIELTKAVFTTKQVVNDMRTILLVVCDEDEEWQFLSGQDVTTSDLRIVSLQNIIDLDQTVKEVLDLKPNMQATRSSSKAAWNKSKLK